MVVLCYTGTRALSSLTTKGQLPLTSLLAHMMRLGKAWLLGKPFLPVPPGNSTHLCTAHVCVNSTLPAVDAMAHNSDIVLLQPQATNPAQSGRSKGHWSMLYAHVQVELSASNEVLTAGSSALLSLSLTHYHAGTQKHFLLWGGASFSYQNMDIRS